MFFQNRFGHTWKLSNYCHCLEILCFGLWWNRKFLCCCFLLRILCGRRRLFQCFCEGLCHLGFFGEEIIPRNFHFKNRFWDWLDFQCYFRDWCFLLKCRCCCCRCFFRKWIRFLLVLFLDKLKFFQSILSFKVLK